MFADLETDKIIKTKLTEVGEESGSKIFWIPLLIFLVFGLYHAYFIYKEDQVELKEHQESGKNCLLEFKVQQCNPMNMTDSCLKLAECFQQADND